MTLFELLKKDFIKKVQLDKLDLSYLNDEEIKEIEELLVRRIMKLGFKNIIKTLHIRKKINHKNVDYWKEFRLNKYCLVCIKPDETNKDYIKFRLKKNACLIIGENRFRSSYLCDFDIIKPKTLINYENIRNSCWLENFSIYRRNFNIERGKESFYIKCFIDYEEFKLKVDIFVIPENNFM